MEQWYSGFTFSHYELPFPTRDCIRYVGLACVSLSVALSRQNSIVDTNR